MQTKKTRASEKRCFKQSIQRKCSRGCAQGKSIQRNMGKSRSADWIQITSVLSTSAGNVTIICLYDNFLVYCCCYFRATMVSQPMAVFPIFQLTVPWRAPSAGLYRLVSAAFFICVCSLGLHSFLRLHCVSWLSVFISCSAFWCLHCIPSFALAPVAHRHMGFLLQ